MAFFIISLIASLVLLYIVGKVWFASTKSRYLIIFFVMGVMAATWTLLNGISAIIPPYAMRVLQPMWMVLVSCLPFLMLAYIMHFVGARFASSRLFTGALIVIALADVAALLTNPLHYLYYTSFKADGSGVYGPLFWAHSYISYAVLAAAFLALLFYVVRNVRKYPHLIMVALGSTCPFIVNILHVFGIQSADYDFTPLGFVVMFSVYGIFSIRFRLFNLKTAASANIFDTLSEGFLIIDNVGNVEDANPAFRAAFPTLTIEREMTTVHDVVGHVRLATVTHQPDDIFARIASPSDGLDDGAFSIRYDDGSTRDFALSKDFIMRRGQSAGYVITLTDISAYSRMIAEINEQNEELITLKDKAEAASRAKTEFLANMSHEIRTPMNAIIGMTAIARGSDDLEKIYGFLDKLDAASHQLLSIINDILDMSKIEANKLELHPEEFCFTEMADDCKNIFLTGALEKKQRLNFDIGEGIPARLRCDKLRLSQVIINILSNSLKFTPEGGEISFKASVAELGDKTARIRVSIADNGIGMTDEQLERLFSAFEQADGSISRRFGGTGLGLAISKRLVNLMGGDIWAESAPGKGSTFTFEFVADICSDSSAENQDAAADSEGAEYDFTGFTVLLAEDVEINREIIVTLMEDTGITIDCAENGQEALDMFKAAPERYDAVFMDLQMPLLDGFTATKYIRALDHPRAASVPIIAMTANAFDEDVQRCFEAGMNDHIAKPIDIAVLFEKTAKYLHIGEE